MKCIVGLGNPGEKYKNNRHNVGFMFVDYLMKELMHEQNATFKEEKKLQVLSYKLQGMLLAKPLTFMNLSGRAVTELFKNFKLKIENLIVVHDDLDIPLGKFKIQKGTGPLLHNGISSIEQAIGTKDFVRVRIGVDNRSSDARVDGETYVLLDFNEEESTLIKSLFPQIFERLKREILE